MPKRLATADEIRAELQYRIDSSKETVGRGCKAPMPMPADKRLHVANWKLPEIIDVPATSIPAVRLLALQVMREFDMKD